MSYRLETFWQLKDVIFKTIIYFQPPPSTICYHSNVQSWRKFLNNTIWSFLAKAPSPPVGLGLTPSGARLGESTVYGRWGLRHLNFVFVCCIATILRKKLRIELFFTFMKSFWGVHVQLLAEFFVQRWAISLYRTWSWSHRDARSQPLSTLPSEPVDGAWLISDDEGSAILRINDSGLKNSCTEGESEANRVIWSPWQQGWPWTQ